MIDIGTNFNYKAPFYLDGRQYVEVPSNKTYYEVLHDWSTPIPDGFEVFCGGKWWTYGENNPVIVTGKFRLRTGGGGGLKFTVSITHPSGSELYIPYNQTASSVTVSWITKYGDDAVAPQTLSIVLNDVTYTPTNPTASGSYTINDVSISGGDQLKVTAGFFGETDTKTVTFAKTYTKYWGALTNETLDTSLLSSLTRVDNATSASLTQTFNCTGGKYPYYVMPKPLYQSVQNTLKMYVDGWENSAYTVTDLTIGNEVFSVIRHDFKQTGTMTIKFTT